MLDQISIFFKDIQKKIQMSSKIEFVIPTIMIIFLISSRLESQDDYYKMVFACFHYLTSIALLSAIVFFLIFEILDTASEFWNIISSLKFLKKK